MDINIMEELEKRKVVATALEWTIGTDIAPDGYEQWLLEEYIYGRVSIQKVIEQLGELSRKSLAPVITWQGSQAA
jgi:hypothetical protein